ncbi:BON domain-containing protein [Planctobacterium marinum]|uniref:BON domain-containing protein n=1 Tax=Planctobacterium marinum TaxID=1631968 RepID=UPI001E4EB29A|nr:BON domain-containing protein [Planctobacterium marinum]MCC2606966.1 BON domain-containing protein [Planctobacterium marinum]
MTIFRKTLTATAFSTLLVAQVSAADWQDDAKDAWIDGKVETTLLLNTELNSFDINTDVKEGKVILTGSVDREVESSLAEELTLSIEGVKSVDNQLVVVQKQEKQPSEKSYSEFTDKKITTVVKTRLLVESDVSGTSIDVDTEKGVVTLNGEVASEAEEQLAVLIAQKTDDVKKVVSNLTVTSEAS